MENFYNSVVKFLYEYTEYMNSTDELKTEFQNIIKYSQENNLTMDDWLNNLCKYFKNTNFDDLPELEDECYMTETEFRHKITITLQNLKDKGLYTDIILNDYSKYI